MPPEKETETPTIESVIDQAIVDASPTPPNNDNAEGGDDDGSAQDPAAQADDAAGDDAAAEAGAGGDADDPAGKGSGDAGAADAGKPGAEGVDDAKGKDGADPAAAAGDAAAKKAAAAAKGDAGDEEAARAAAAKAKQPDPVNDPIPEEVKGKTRTRMTALIDTAKTATKELEESRSQTDGFLKAIAETGADPEGFARHVEVLRLMNSPDANEQRQALKFLRHAATKLATDLGEREPGKELEGHDDLAEELENGDITRARAIEIANARNAQKAGEERAQREAAANEQTTKEQQAINDARAELNTLEKEMAAADPHYYRKRAAIENAAKALIPTIPPKQWKAAFKRLIDTVDVTKLPRAAPRVGDGGLRRNVPAGTGDRQPMRPKQGAGGGAQKAPTSPLEAVSFGIEQANARR